MRSETFRAGLPVAIDLSELRSRKDLLPGATSSVAVAERLQRALLAGGCAGCSRLAEAARAKQKDDTIHATIDAGQGALRLSA
eukprot:SAG31_NODE_25125_length_467_cov_1.119565_1_plen_82_part_10